jgi:hypothetical protein
VEEQIRPDGMWPPAPGWNPDPWGRHELRYWDGGQWTGHVADGGTVGLEWADMPAPTEAPAPTNIALGATLEPVGAAAAVAGPSYGARPNGTPSWAKTRAGLATLPGRPPPSPHFSGPPAPSLAESPIGDSGKKWYKAKWFWLTLVLIAIVAAAAFIVPSLGSTDKPAITKPAAPISAPSGYEMIETANYQFAAPQDWATQELDANVMESATGTAGNGRSGTLTVVTDPSTGDTINVVPYRGFAGDALTKANQEAFEADFREGIAGTEVVDLKLKSVNVHGLPSVQLVASLVSPDGISTVISTLIQKGNDLHQITVSSASAERASTLNSKVLPTFRAG